MKHFGFNPFVRALRNQKEGIIYDLLEGNIYIVPPQVVDLFSGKTYKSYEKLKRDASKSMIGEEELKKLIEVGKSTGVILEVSKSYWRNEIMPPMEYQFPSKGEIVFSFKKIWLQPSGKCDRKCDFCNSFLNCCCFSNGKEWRKNELEILLKDLERFEGFIELLEIFGGNPLLYSHIEVLLSGLKRLKPKLINLNIPITSTQQLLDERIRKLKQYCKIDFEITFLVFQTSKDISLLKVSELAGRNKIKILLVGEKNEFRKELKEKSTFKLEYLLKKDLSNIEWYKEKVKDNFLEPVYFFDFYYRKYSHRCWGDSFSIDSEGRVKPCLWSDRIFGSWDKGRIIHIIDELNLEESFGMQKSLGKIEGCGDCIYRFGCRDCRVIAEFLSGQPKAKNPLCER